MPPPSGRRGPVACRAAERPSHVCTCCCSQYQVLRRKGTEPANTGTYNKFTEAGIYECTGCGSPLYTCVGPRRRRAAKKPPAPHGRALRMFGCG
jgi:hypothetical protein